MKVKMTKSGYIFISPQDDCKAIVDAMLAMDYNEEFCLADDFSPEFIIELMEAGFLIMSAEMTFEDREPFYLLFPKLHLTRSALLFKNLHVKKSIRRFLNRYELKADVEFERIVDCCVEKHGNDWLTPPLVDCIKEIRRMNPRQKADENQPLSPTASAYPASFALYRDGKLVAGEFGVVYEKVYTSYSGYYDEDNAGTVQLILTTRYLEEHGFSFFDMGMPLDYKNELGAIDISPLEFVLLFRDQLRAEEFHRLSM